MGKAKNASGPGALKNLPSGGNPGTVLSPVTKIKKVSTIEKASNKEPQKISDDTGKMAQVLAPEKAASKEEPETPEVAGTTKHETEKPPPTVPSGELKNSIGNKPNECRNESDNKQHQLGQQNKEQHAANNNSITVPQKTGPLGGVIFLCNMNTKPDVFRYMVMGFPDSKVHLVMSIKPDLKLFLYDYHSRVIHGIYKAASHGGMRLEPAAFKGSFPAQVRFTVEREFPPLPFSSVCDILENYDSRPNLIKPELTVDQVIKLSGLFFLNSMVPRPMPPNQSGQNGPKPFMPRPPVMSAHAFPHPQPGAVPGPQQLMQSGSQHVQMIHHPHALIQQFGSMPNPLVPPGSRFPVSVLGPDARGFGPRQNMLAHSQRPSMMPAGVPLMAPTGGLHTSVGAQMSLAPRNLPSMQNPMGLKTPGSQPQHTASPANMPVSHKYTFELNANIGKANSQKSEAASSRPPQVSEKPHMRNEIPLPINKLHETSSIQELRHRHPSLLSTHQPISHTAVPEHSSVYQRHDPYIPPQLPQGPTNLGNLVAQPPSNDYRREVDRSRMDHSDRMPSLRATHVQDALDYNRRQRELGSKSDTDSLPVSSRYSFDGPTVKYR